MKNRLPCQTKLRLLLDYDDNLGVLYWKERGPAWFQNKTAHSMWSARCAGRVAFGTPTNQGYQHGKLDGRSFKTHRIIWKLVYGYDPVQIDHINGDRSCNRLDNLRDVSNAENSKNRRVQKNNKSGVPGVVWLKRENRWNARIKVNGQFISLGNFTEASLAAAARKAAERRYGFHENNGSRVD